MIKKKEFILCPKCHRKSLGKSAVNYYCHLCHEYFGLEELIEHWGYDIGDFHDIPAPMVVRTDWVTFYTDEPVFESITERLEAYAMVDRMFAGISELDDYMDLKMTQFNALGVLS